MRRRVTAGGSGFLLTNVPGYTTDYHGIELGVVKRLSNKWMGRAGFSFNNAREHFDGAASMIDFNGNPTRDGHRAARERRPVRAAERRQRRRAPSTSTRSGSSTRTPCIRRRTASKSAATCSAARAIRSRCVRQQTLGNDARLQVLVTPEIDTFRYPNLWNTDLRAAREFRFNQVKIRGIIDAFNVFNANTALVRVNNITAANLNALAQNLSPRIFRVGLVVGF